MIIKMLTKMIKTPYSSSALIYLRHKFTSNNAYIPGIRHRNDEGEWLTGFYAA